MASHLRAGAVQLNSNDNKDRNLEVAGSLVRGAAKAGAELIVLPEKFNLLGATEQMLEGAEPLAGETLRWASALARFL